MKSLFDQVSGFDGGDQLQGLRATLIQSMRFGEAGAGFMQRRKSWDE
ncbi:MAG: hypothetical protein ACNA8P_04795 [Phycisphaerales bacterium]